jgi:UDP-N-acetylmuramoyl-tripeptide--D-alanyl-D-alanine ligase
MMTLTAGQLAQRFNGQLHGADVEFRGMSHDTRLIEPGNLFAALPGAHSDGHDHLEQAASAGAAAALVSQPVSEQISAKLACVQVSDVLQAMGQAARWWRDQLDVVVIGVTGSNGKTTVKEMIAAMLSRVAPTLATRGNYNNEIGVPLTLSRLHPDHRYAVIEMGCARPGDIHYLATLASPDLAVVTNAQAAHLEGLGSVTGVARTKGELFSALPAHGTAIINADDPHVELWLDLAAHCKTLRFGLDEHQAEVHGYFAEPSEGTSELGQPSSVIVLPSGTVRVQAALPGRHNLMNACAALAVIEALQLDTQAAAEVLSQMPSMAGRFKRHQHAEGWMVIDDSYNANPGSMRAGMAVLTDMSGEPWMVLGDMLELGDDASLLHAELGAFAAQQGIKQLFCLGPNSAAAAQAFGPGAQHYSDHAALVADLKERLMPGVNCLVKGSRGMAMERIVEGLLEESI